VFCGDAVGDGGGGEIKEILRQRAHRTSINGLESKKGVSLLDIAKPGGIWQKSRRKGLGVGHGEKIGAER